MGRRVHLRRALVFGGLAVSAGCTYLAVRSIDLEVFVRALRESEIVWLLPSFVVLAVAVLLRVVRWGLLFPRGLRPDHGQVARALLIGLLFNNILPARAGEAARVVALHRESGVSSVEAAATAVSERVLDLLSLLGLLLVLLLFLPGEGWLEAVAGYVVVVAAVLLAGVAALVRLSAPAGALVARLFPRMSRRLPRDAGASMRRGLAIFTHPALALGSFALTTASWLVLAVSAWLASLAFELSLGVLAAVLVVVAMNFAAAVPSSPGSLGVFEAAILLALGVFGVDESRALSYAVVWHALNFLPFVAIGWAVLHWHGAVVKRRGDSTEASPGAMLSRRVPS